MSYCDKFKKTIFKSLKLVTIYVFKWPLLSLKWLVYHLKFTEQNLTELVILILQFASSRSFRYDLNIIKHKLSTSDSVTIILKITV